MNLHNRGRVVIGVSLSLSGLAALRHAVAEARRHMFGEVVAVRSWVDVEYGWRQPPRPADELARASAAVLDRAFDQAFVTMPADVRITRHTPRGKPGPVLADLAADDTALIVVGSRRARWLGTGVAGQCIRYAPCPVMVVPPPLLARRTATSVLTGGLDRELRRLTDDPHAW
ncbi:universal stress protein [Actinoplanes couchii]|nr:universal stress protein [Actinoplanes couchii]MDR6318706.1 nucleotide-binding universal stress UspA family protein [Actinoplanes couchii]